MKTWLARWALPITLAAGLLLVYIFTHNPIDANLNLAFMQKFLQTYRSTFWLICILLLWLDFILPIPSILVIASAALCYGFVLGSLISIIGLSLCSTFAFILGKFWRDFFLSYFKITDKNQAYFYYHFKSGAGYFGLFFSRGIPVFQEVYAFMAGLYAKSWKKSIFYCVLGSIQPSLLISALTLNQSQYKEELISFFLLLIWIIAMWMRKKIMSTKDSIL